MLLFYLLPLFLYLILVRQTTCRSTSLEWCRLSCPTDPLRSSVEGCRPTSTTTRFGGRDVSFLVAVCVCMSVALFAAMQSTCILQLALNDVSWARQKGFDYTHSDICVKVVFTQSVYSPVPRLHSPAFYRIVCVSIKKLGSGVWE